MSELVNGRTSCHKTLLQIYKWQSYPKKDLLSVQLASHLVEGPTDVEDAPAPAH